MNHTATPPGPGGPNWKQTVYLSYDDCWASVGEDLAREEVIPEEVTKQVEWEVSCLSCPVLSASVLASSAAPPGPKLATFLVQRGKLTRSRPGRHSQVDSSSLILWVESSQLLERLVRFIPSTNEFVAC